MPDVGEGVCRAPECRAQILWVRTQAGKLIPLDRNPEQRIVLHEAARGALVAVSHKTYMPHHATCPKASDFRKARPGSSGSTEAAVEGAG